MDKYSCDSNEFEVRVKKSSKEDFEKWDDYIEWKAYINSLKEIELKLKELKSAKDIKIT